MLNVECSVLLTRLEHDEKCQKYLKMAFMEPRRSTRIQKNRRKSIETPKPILKAGRRARAKSVSFDMSIVSPVQRNLTSSVNRLPAAGPSNEGILRPAVARNVQLVQRNLFGDPKSMVNIVHFSSLAGSSDQGILQPAVARSVPSDSSLPIDLSLSLLRAQSDNEVALDLSRKAETSENVVAINVAQMGIGGDLDQNKSKDAVGHAATDNASQMDMDDGSTQNESSNDAVAGHVAANNITQMGIVDDLNQNESSNDAGAGHAVADNIVQMDVGDGSIRNGVSYYVDVSTTENDNSGNDNIAAYETRIQSLIASNRAKINRILELQADRSGLMAQNYSLDLINRSLVQAIDEYNAKENGPESVADGATQTRRLSDEIGILQSRIEGLNEKIVGLRDENERFKAIFKSYGSKVLAEHNYNK